MVSISIISIAYTQALQLFVIHPSNLSNVGITLYTCASTHIPSCCMYARCTSHSSKCILVTFTDVSFPFFHRECCALLRSYICKNMDGDRGVVGMGLHGAP